MRATCSDARTAPSRAPRLFAAEGVAAGAAWALRHTTARAVRAWRPGTGRFRSTAATLAIVVSPDLPAARSRRAVQHTWPAYRGAMSIFFEDWATALQQLIEAGVAVKLIVGSDDHSRVPGLADQLAGIRRTSPLFQSPTRLIFCRSLTANSVSMKSS